MLGLRARCEGQIYEQRHRTSGGHARLLVTLYFDFAPSRDVAVVLFEGHSKSMTARAVGNKKYIIRLRRGNSGLRLARPGLAMGVGGKPRFT